MSSKNTQTVDRETRGRDSDSISQEASKRQRGDDEPEVASTRSSRTYMNEDDPPRRSARPFEVEHDPRESPSTYRETGRSRHEGRHESSNENGKRAAKHYTREGPDEIKGTFGRRLWGIDSKTKKKYWMK